jgi:hypothetical protein
MNNLPTERHVKPHISFRPRLIGIIILAFAAGMADAEDTHPPSVRVEVGKPLQAAIELLKARKGKEALQRLKEAEVSSDRTPYETYLIDRVRGQAAAAAGEAALAARSFEAAAVSPAAPAADRLPMLAAAAGKAYAARDYPRVAELAGRYVKDGGTDAGVRTLQVQALYLVGDYPGAGRELTALLQVQEQGGRAATEEQLQLSTSICRKQHDSACYGHALERLLAAYPKPDYWLAAIHEVSTAPAFPSRLALDVARLKLYTQTLRTTAEYFEAAQLALQEGFPAEARDFIERGYSSGQLGSGPEADRHRRLRDMVAKALADDNRTLGQDDAAAAAGKDGTALFNTGFNYVLRGQVDKGVPMMEQALRKGGLKRPEDGKLRLGTALALAGRGAASAQILTSIPGKDSTAELARLWAIAARQRHPGTDR